MEGQGVGADDEELNPVRDQRAEELVEVPRQFHHAASARTRRRPIAFPVFGFASIGASRRPLHALPMS
jgi:hypothetical protein